MNLDLQAFREWLLKQQTGVVVGIIDSSDSVLSRFLLSQTHRPWYVCVEVQIYGPLPDGGSKDEGWELIPEWALQFAALLNQGPVVVCREEALQVLDQVSAMTTGI